jgi:hypothetical protein
MSVPLEQDQIIPVSVKQAAPLPAARYFYSGAALLLVVLMIWGFQHFYFHGKAYPGRELTPPIRTLVILHGSAMATWMLLYAVQPILIAKGKRRLHMNLGKAGAVIAFLVVLLGLRLGIESARVNPPDLLLWGLNPRQFLTVPLISISAFGLLVAFAIWKRMRRDIHRPMMLTAVLVAMPAALDRIDSIKSLYIGSVWGNIFGPYFSTLVLGLLLLIVNWILFRKLDRWLAIGWAGIVLVGALTMRLATSGIWDSFVSMIL